MTNGPSTKSRGYTVIIPSKDRVPLLREALDSSFGQSLTPDSVQLVIDEPEDRNKYAFLAQYDSRLQVHFTGGGFGGARARNVGLELVATPFLFFLDDDDLWLPHKIERQIQALEEHPDWLGITCWQTEECDGEAHEHRVSPRRLRRFCRALNLVGSFSQFGMRLNEQTRALRLEPGLRSAQDFEFYLQLSRLGPIGLVNEVLIRYRSPSGTRITGSDKSKYETMQAVYWKHRGSFTRKEEFFWRAKLVSFMENPTSNLIQRLRLLLRVAAYLVRSGSIMFEGHAIVRRAAAQLFRRE